MANVAFAHVPCKNCHRPVRVRTGISVLNDLTAVFCSMKCNKAYVAREGTKQQEEAYRAGRDLSGDKK